MLYIEQPAGVGFSYCDHDNHPEDCKHSDNTMARDNLDALLEWYVKFPEYKVRELYLTGESYAGIYVPYTANAIYHHNQAAQRNGGFQPKLMGFMVGNGVTNWRFDTTPAFLRMGYWHSLYDTRTYEKMQELGCEFWSINFDVYPS